MDDLNRLALPELYEHFARTGLVRRLVELARDEDLGCCGDRTSEASIDPAARATGAVVCRSGGVIGGLAVIPEVVRAFAPGGAVDFSPRARDGDRAAPGAVLATLSGSLRDLLAIERTLLNFVGRLSGVATRTARFVEAIGPGAKAGLYDTRKTTPGLRVLEKYAVRCGGGRCHRIGLYDALLLKDNHLAGVTLDQLASFVAAASKRARETRRGDGLQFVQVEVESAAMLERVLALPAGLVDIVLLDNMTTAQLAESVAVRDRLAPGVELEASGGVTLETVGVIAATGVDRISAGTLTHGATWVDVALDMD